MIYLLEAKPKFGSHAIFAIVFAVYVYVFWGIFLTPLMRVDCCNRKLETWRN